MVDDISAPPPLMLGGKKSTLPWEIAAWLLLAGGIFSRQGLDFPRLVWKLSNVSSGALVASLVVALAVFPMMMRWLNRRRRRAGFEHITAPFAFGFFVDLAVLAAAKIPATFTTHP
jgi:ABC-type amino acid transport system permease subunit